MALSENPKSRFRPPGRNSDTPSEKEKRGLLGIEALTASLPASFPSEARVIFRAVARTVGRSSDL